ncbi:hypothetical protein STENM223S_07493 [Streptomyces tendae]
MPSPARGRFFMSLNASTREMSESRPVSTACPIPAEASTTTDSAVTARLCMAQRGFFRRTGGLGGRRDGPGAAALRRRPAPGRGRDPGGAGRRGQGDTSAGAGPEGRTWDS